MSNKTKLKTNIELIYTQIDVHAFKNDVDYYMYCSTL